MRANIIILGVIAAFFYLCAAVYTLWHIAFYLVLTYRGQGGEHPSDLLEAEIDDADPDEGHFSPWSWWPISLGAAFALLFLSITGPTFLVPIAGALLVIVMIGWVYEHYRGNFSR